MKALIVFLLLLSSTAEALTATIYWTRPTSRENGTALALADICCYEINGRNAQNKRVWTIVVPSKADKHSYFVNIPDALGVVKFEIAATDTNGVYSRFVPVEKAKPLLAPTDGEIF
jgi:hypothetical protein